MKNMYYLISRMRGFVIRVRYQLLLGVITKNRIKLQLYNVQAKYHGSCDMAMENGTAVWRLRLRYAISGCRASYRSTNSAQTIQVAPCGLQLYPCIVSCCRKQISGCCNVVARLLALLLIQDAHSPCSSCTVL